MTLEDPVRDGDCEQIGDSQGFVGDDMQWASFIGWWIICHSYGAVGGCVSMVSQGWSVDRYLGGGLVTDYWDSTHYGIVLWCHCDYYSWVMVPWWIYLYFFHLLAYKLVWNWAEGGRLVSTAKEALVEGGDKAISFGTIGAERINLAYVPADEAM